MPQPAALRSLTGFWRTAVIGAAAGLGAAAVCLVVFGTTLRQQQLGVLLGLWGAVIAASLIFGSRRAHPDVAAAAELEQARAQAAELHEAQLKVVAQQQEQLQAARQAYFMQEIEFRQFGELQLARDAAARRESELNLELSLRRELERVMAAQLGSLREEVAALRAEVLDKLGGQFRLERIETTRVTGSDLDALQNEIRRLAGTQPVLSVQPAAPAQPGSPRRSEARSTGIVDAELVAFPPAVAELPPAPQPRAQPIADQEALGHRTEQAQPVEQAEQAQPVEQTQPVEQARQAQQTEHALYAASQHSEQRTGRRRAPEDALADASRYQGRRRAKEEGASRLASLDR
jgi:hypothetical protein